MDRLVIPFRLPSLNEYIDKCRKNRYEGARMKKRVENDIALYINTLPTYTKPIKIKFCWVENNRRRDLDNICFAKKFILDSMVKCGKLQDDNRKFVCAFTDSFSYDSEAKIILEIEEVSI